MTADLERRLRALRDDLPEPPTTIDPAALISGDVVELGAGAALRRSRTRWAVAALVAAALVVGVVVAVQLVRGGRVDRSAPVGSVSDRIDPAALVIHDGDRVEGSGTVIAVDGQPVLFCQPESGSASVSNAPFDPRDDCHHSVTVTGVDLTKLDDVEPFSDGVTGRAHLVGTYRGGSLTDVVQSSFTSPPNGLPQPPCAAPAGGWPRGDRNGNADWGPVEKYQAAHPGEILASAALSPSDTQVVIYLLTAHDPGPVESEIAPQVKQGLCVVRSVYSQAQLDAAVAPFDLMSPLAERTGIWSYSPAAYEADGQLSVEVYLTMVTPELVAIAEAQPAGLVQYEPWLSPVRS